MEIERISPAYAPIVSNSVEPGEKTSTAAEPNKIKIPNDNKIDAAKECQTCANRKYQDSSGDPGVSFKAPTKLTPNQAASAVPAHEREHYSRESAKAKQEGREVVSNDIKIFTSICPECGRTYVSGGETRTVTRKKAEREDFANNFYEGVIGKNLPKKFDIKI